MFGNHPHRALRSMFTSHVLKITDNDVSRTQWQYNMNRGASRDTIRSSSGLDCITYKLIHTPQHMQHISLGVAELICTVEVTVRRLSNKFPTIFSSLIFTFHCPGYAIFLTKEETSNFRIRKCDREGNQKNPHFRNTFSWIANKFFGKVILKPL